MKLYTYSTGLMLQGSTSWPQLRRFFLLAVVAFFGAWSAVEAGASQFDAVECSNPNPRTSPVWRNFEKFVSQEYAHGRPISSLEPEVKAIALGHALGRVSLAQEQDPVRQEAVACLQLGIEQMYAIIPGVYGRKNEDQQRRLYRFAINAAMGRHDDWVQKYTGVTATNPAYEVLGVAAPSPRPTWRQPVAQIPAKPVYQSGRQASLQSGVKVPSEVEYCRKGVYSVYSVAEANRLVGEAGSIVLPADCYNTTDYLACKKVSDLLYSAIDHLTQVMMVSRSPVGHGCRYCDLKPRFSSVGEKIDRISSDLYQKGYRSAPSSDQGWHFSTLEKEALCKTPPVKGSFSISPVTRDACPEHCASAAPECNYAYYVARTQTCSWADDQTAPNLHALAASDIWDRAQRRWLTQANGPHQKHLCKDQTVEPDAWARMYSRGYGGGQASYGVKQEHLCFRKSFSKIAGATVQHFECRDDQFEDCSLKKTDKVERQQLGGGTYKILFNGGKSWWTITPETKVDLPRPQPVHTSLPGAGFAGDWATNWGKMTLGQDGIGAYSHQKGRIKGVMSGNVLVGTWSEAPTYLPPNDAGDVEFTLSADGNSFNGRWRYGATGPWHSDWQGKRAR